MDLDNDDNLQISIENSLVSDKPYARPKGRRRGGGSGGGRSADVVSGELMKEDIGRAVGSYKKPNAIMFNNLHFNITEPDLTDMVAPFGNIVDLRMIYDNAGRSEGIAFVAFDNMESAQIAQQHLDQAVIDGHTMSVECLPSVEERIRIANELLSPVAGTEFSVSLSDGQQQNQSNKRKKGDGKGVLGRLGPSGGSVLGRLGPGGTGAVPSGTLSNRLGPKAPEAVLNRLGPQRQPVASRLGDKSEGVGGRDSRNGGGASSRPPRKFNHTSLNDDIDAYMRGDDDGTSAVAASASNGENGWGNGGGQRPRNGDWDAPALDMYRTTGGGLAGRAMLNYDDVEVVAHGDLEEDGY
ncbi:hypothetical protein HDU97_004668 [Phlyctochytrium planicorne]|nr:hypothetical protein HDU97_004668 [Phlyctochytrium planicorne]